MNATMYSSAHLSIGPTRRPLDKGDLQLQLERQERQKIIAQGKKARPAEEADQAKSPQ